MDTHASGLEGKFTICLRTSDGVVADVVIESQRRLAATALLCGRPPSEAVRLLPLVYSLCGEAQCVAGLQACEHAIGIGVAEAQSGARGLLVLSEATAENARRVMLDWPELLGIRPEVPRLVEVRKLLADCSNCLFPDGAWRKLGGGALSPDRARLHQTLEQIDIVIAGALDGACAKFPFRELDDLQTFDRWLRCADTPVADCLRAVRANGHEGLGVAEVERLDGPDWDLIVNRMAAGEGGRFASSPDIDGRPRETGPIVRHWDHPLIADMRRAYGCGLLARLAARIMDVALAPARLAALAQTIGESAPAVQEPINGGRGHAAVDTARGWLVHMAEIENGSIRRYEILAPTDWNFHPEGALAQGLLSLSAPNGQTLRDKAELCVASIDPCTAYEIVVEEGHA